jgi:hypothetical protein
MKVYELIQALAQVDADCEVKIDYEVDKTFTCPYCEKDFDDTTANSGPTVDETDYNKYLKTFYILFKD